MVEMLRRRLPVIGLAALAVTSMALLGACGDDDDDAEAAGADTSNAVSVVSGISFLDKAGLHDIDTSINEEKTVPGDARTTALKAASVTKLTAWPADLQDEASALGQIFAEMAAALDGDSPDMAAAGAAATKAHDAQHDFSHEVWQWVYGEAGIETGEEGGHD